MGRWKMDEFGWIFEIFWSRFIAECFRVVFGYSHLRQVCYQHLATMAVPPEHQGRIFSLLNVLASVGSLAPQLQEVRLEGWDSESMLAPTNLAGMGQSAFIGETVQKRSKSPLLFSTKVALHEATFWETWLPPASRSMKLPSTAVALFLSWWPRPCELAALIVLRNGDDCSYNSIVSLASYVRFGFDEETIIILTLKNSPCWFCCWKKGHPRS